jgi:hypothetical protein
MNCAIPILLAILAPDPCAVYGHLQAEHAKVENTRALERWFRGLPDDRRTLEETVSFTGLIAIEEPEPFFCGVPESCLGTFSRFLGVPTIRYVKGFESLGVVYHELSHMAYTKWHSEAEGEVVGHGGATDPHYMFVKQWLAWQYPIPGHPYNPILAPSRSSTASAHDFTCSFFMREAAE